MANKNTGLAIAITLAGIGATWWWYTSRQQSNNGYAATPYGGGIDALGLPSLQMVRNPQTGTYALPTRMAPAVAPQQPGSGTRLAAGLATGAATTAGTVATTALTAATGFATFGISAAAALLGWGIGQKGWFRGGEVGVQVNPNRDQFMSQFGPGGTDVNSGFGRLAAQLSAWTGEPDGSHYFKNLIGATSMDALVQAEREIALVFAAHGQSISSL